MEYLSVSEVSERWGISIRQVKRLLADGRIYGARKCGRVWMIPDDAGKPSDQRGKSRSGKRPAPSAMSEVIRIPSEPMPGARPDSI